MRNLIAFIWRHHFIFLFFLLEAFCVSLLIQNSRYSKSTFINSSNAVSASVYRFFDEMIAYFSLKKANHALASENASLRAGMKYSFSEYNRGLFRIENTLYRQQFQYVAGKVVNNSITRRNNYFTLAVGSSQGVKEGMGVISGSGVAGIVKSVSGSYCSVMSVLHKNTRISARIKKSGYFGNLVWDGKNYRQATLLEVPKHVELDKGDTIVSSGFSTLYPEGILVGTVENFMKDPEDNFLIVTVNLSTDFGSIDYGYVIVNLFASEQQTLETQSQND